MGIKSSYSCMQCKLFVTKMNVRSKYCSNKCQQNYRWENETKPNILNGIEGSPTTLKRLLIEQFEEKCSECGVGNFWNNKPLTIQLDHIDGNSDNNLITNVRLLCPNCHTQTENFGSKGKGSRYKKITKRNQYLRDYKSLSA